MANSRKAKTGRQAAGAVGVRFKQIQKDKVKPIEKAVLNILPEPPEDISFDDLVDRVAHKVNPIQFPLRKTVSQYTKVVQLDLEKRGIIERLPGVSPIRLRRLSVTRK